MNNEDNSLINSDINIDSNNEEELENKSNQDIVIEEENNGIQC